MSNYDEIIQDCINKIEKSTNSRILLVKACKETQDGTTNFWSNIQKKNKGALLSCGLFKEIEVEKSVPKEYLEFSELGWRVVVDYNGKYKTYKETIEPVSSKLITNTNKVTIGVGALIVLQLIVSVFQCLIAFSQLKNDKSETDKQIEILQQIQETRKIDYCHSCGDR